MLTRRSAVSQGIGHLQIDQPDAYRAEKQERIALKIEAFYWMNDYSGKKTVPVRDNLAGGTDTDSSQTDTTSFLREQALMNRTRWNFLFSVGLLATVVFAVGQAQAATIFSDDFEGYADTTAMQAVWGAAGLGSLDPNNGNPGQSMAHPGGTDNIVTVPTQHASAGTPLIYTADIYDDGTSANKRFTAALRSASVANLLEMGMYNGPSHYAVRAVLPGPSWVGFSSITDDGGAPLLNVPVAGWHRFQVTLDGTNATFTLDLGSTGIINATEVLAAPWHGNGVDSIRLGGPSNASSAGGGGNFDNVSLVSIPEPSALMLLSLAGLGLVAKRRR